MLKQVRWPLHSGVPVAAHTACIEVLACAAASQVGWEFWEDLAAPVRALSLVVACRTSALLSMDATPQQAVRSRRQHSASQQISMYRQLLKWCFGHALISLLIHSVLAIS